MKSLLKMKTPLSEKQQDILAAILLGIILLVNGLFLSRYAFSQLNFFDMAPMLDAFWRVFHGQRPYADFIFSIGPMHLYVADLFFHIFGFGKFAILAQLIFFTSVLAVLSFFALRRKVAFWINALLTLLLVSSFYWNIAHPWYDQLAHFWGFLAVFLLLSQRPFPTDRRAAGTGFICGALVALSIMSKTNIGPAYAAVFLIVLSDSARKKAALLGYVLGGVTGILLCLVFLVRFPQPFFSQILLHTGTTYERLLKMLTPRNWFVNYYWVAVLFVLAQGKAFLKKNRENLALFLGITAVGIFSVQTGGIIPEANIYLWGMQMILAFILFAEGGKTFSGEQNRIYAFSHKGLILWAAVLCVLSIRSGLELKVWDRSEKHSPFGTYALRTGPWAGWKTFAGQGQPLDALAEAVSRYVPAEDSLLNLTDMYMIYAMTGRDSYKGIPVIFHDKISPAPGAQTRQVRDYILAHPPDWVIIFLTSFQEELHSLGLAEEIRDHYTPMFRAGFYLLMKRTR